MSEGEERSIMSRELWTAGEIEKRRIEEDVGRI